MDELLLTFSPHVRKYSQKFEMFNVFIQGSVKHTNTAPIQANGNVFHFDERISLGIRFEH